MKKMQLQKHINSIWITNTYTYKNRKIVIKSKKNHGIKCHIFYPNSKKVEFTLRYHFILPKDLLKKAKNKIDLKKNTVIN